MRNLLLLGFLAGLAACSGREDGGWGSDVDIALALLDQGQVEAALAELPTMDPRAEAPAWLEPVCRALLDRRAVAAADSLLELQTIDTPLRSMLRAEVLEYQGHLAQARALYASIPQDAPQHHDALTKIAMIAALEQDHTAAIEAARTVLAEDVLDKVARAVLAESLLETGQVEEAHQELVLLPEGSKRWMLDARIHLARGEPAGALDPLRRVLELTPGAPKPLYYLGQAFLGTGQLELAVKPLEKLAGEDPPFQDSQYLLATAYRRMGRTAAADSVLAAFQNRRQRQEVEALRGEGVTRSESGQLEEALDYLERAVELDPDHPELHNDLGIVLARLRRFDEAEREFVRAAGIDPDDATIQRNLANLYHATGDTLRRDEAIARYRELVDGTTP